MPGRVAPREPRILLYDIETTNLNPAFGTCLCIGWKWYGEPDVHCPSILDRRHRDALDDADLIKQWVYGGPYEDADWAIGWYSRRFDLLYLKARAIKHRFRPFPPTFNVDLWYEWRKQFRLEHNRLNSVQQFLKTPTPKTPIDYEAWQRAALGNKDAMGEVVKHCKADIVALEDVYRLMKPWMDAEPGRELFDAKPDFCPSCGDEKLWSHGYKVTQAGVYRRFQCQKCGHYCRGKSALTHTAKRNTI